MSSRELCFEKIHQAMICRMDCKMRGMGSKEGREKGIAVIQAGGISVWTGVVEEETALVSKRLSID